jgi:hypothetical protein
MVSFVKDNLDFREKLVENIRSRMHESKKDKVLKAPLSVRPQTVLIQERQKEIEKKVNELRSKYAKILSD